MKERSQRDCRHMAGGGLATLGATQTGGCPVLLPAFDPERVLHLIEVERTPMMICVPMMPGKILHRPEIHRPSIRPSPTLSLGGALVPSYLVRSRADSRAESDDGFRAERIVSIHNAHAYQ
jgi:acyl-CoA synthetase (AMP-forming)/AMP-acid ligase II